MTTIVKIDRTFLEEQTLISTIMMNMFIDRSKAFYDALSMEVTKLGYSDVNAETIRTIQMRLRNQRDIELMAGMDKIAKSVGFLFDYQQAITFMEEYMVGQGNIEAVDFDTEVKLAVLDRASLLFSLDGSPATNGDKGDLDTILKGARQFAKELINGSYGTSLLKSGITITAEFNHDDIFKPMSETLGAVWFSPTQCPVQDVITTHKPKLSEPRGKLRSVK